MDEQRNSVNFWLNIACMLLVLLLVKTLICGGSNTASNTRDELIRLRAEKEGIEKGILLGK